MKGHVEVVEVLLAVPEVDVNAVNSDGRTALHCAARFAHAEVVRMLVDAGADVNAADNNGYTPLDAVLLSPLVEQDVRDAVVAILRDYGGETRNS